MVDKITQLACDMVSGMVSGLFSGMVRGTISGTVRGMVVSSPYFSYTAKDVLSRGFS